MLVTPKQYILITDKGKEVILWIWTIYFHVLLECFVSDYSYIHSLVLIFSLSAHGFTQVLYVFHEIINWKIKFMFCKTNVEVSKCVLCLTWKEKMRARLRKIFSEKTQELHLMQIKNLGFYIHISALHTSYLLWREHLIFSFIAGFWKGPSMAKSISWVWLRWETHGWKPLVPPWAQDPSRPWPDPQSGAVR